MNIKRPYIKFKTSELIIFVEKEINTLKRYEIEHLINEILFRKKAKDKLKVNKYNPVTRKHEIFVEKKLPPHSK